MIARTMGGRRGGEGVTVNPAFEPDADRNESFC